MIQRVGRGEAVSKYNQEHQKRPVRPDWAAAPEWANYCAKDADGDWHWFSHRPQLLGKRHKVWRVTIGRVDFAFSGNPSSNFRKDCYARPAEEPQFSGDPSLVCGSDVVLENAKHG